MMKREGNSRRGSKEGTKREKKRVYFLTALIVILLFVTSGILFLAKTKETEILEWISYLCMNLAVGTAITAFFLYFGKAREREYRINKTKRELGYLVGNVNMSISGMRYGLKLEKEMLLEAFMNRKRVSIDKDILSSEEPTLIDSYELFEKKCDKLECLILKHSKKNSQDNLSTIRNNSEIDMGKEESDAIDALQESCYEIADTLNIFIGS